ncbi:ATP-binding cassette, subfamily B/ATP-binding cassette, subfamily B, MsbA [Abditibacterium utsteinense]|uniref:ATP-binding cassette, subfamily B/ATP-binding cassette, subfamily B, MsbA n=1 Tax=Abditibacterium utsteinense TaxID=1960156 RepID=A0A2S8SVI1_9BACT|nr:ABC transporter ATP-binding protein [Abditibacterium utsteinense]PQV64799.1 ATP-binding cassette, subfamily B/ATP-binding cassette, subfamily B, MsbA [Abditibacterium utsteinense]
MNIYRRLLEEITPHWKLLAGSLGFSVVMAAMEMVPAALTQLLIDSAIKLSDWPLLKNLSIALLAALIFRTIAHYARMKYTGVLAHRVLYQVRTKLYEHLQSLSISFYQNKRTGQIMSRVTNDVAVLEQFIVEGIRESVVNVLRVVIIAAILFHTNAQLMLLTLVPTLPLIFMTQMFQKRIGTSYRQMRRRLADMNSILSDTIGGIRVVQIFGQEDFEASKFRAKSAEFADAGNATQHMQAIFFPAVALAFGAGQVIVWLVGGREVLRGRLQTGELIMFSAYVSQFYAPVQTLASSANLFANTSASAERIYEILDTEPDIRSVEAATALPEMKGEIDLENVTFGYDSGESAIENINLHVAAGQMVGLVGPSGSGKSTLVSLITRFYDVKDGSVKIDGHDIREVDLKDLRSNISVVPQEAYLFHGSIRDNIAYGRPDADFLDVMNAARGANAHDFIMRQSDGYDTHVGERGAKLSGGERQRISIARAILDDPKILILDEATSAVDTESEVAIQTALDNLMAGRTTLAIAHRLSTVKNADKLVVMEQGKIVEEGTHEELILLEDGLYKRLVEMQTKLGSETE